MPSESITRTIETGAFYRTIIRKGKKRRQKTLRMKKNDLKVVLGHIGEFEVYVFPYLYPDRVFIGKFPVNTQITLGNLQNLLGVYNRIRWYLKGEPFRKPRGNPNFNTKKSNLTRERIKSAYNKGLQQTINKQKERELKKNQKITVET